jgi:hypothetical protein
MISAFYWGSFGFLDPNTSPNARAFHDSRMGQTLTSLVSLGLIYLMWGGNREEAVNRRKNLELGDPKTIMQLLQDLSGSPKLFAYIPRTLDYGARMWTLLQGVQDKGGMIWRNGHFYRPAPGGGWEVLTWNQKATTTQGQWTPLPAGYDPRTAPNATRTQVQHQALTTADAAGLNRPQVGPAWVNSARWQTVLKTVGLYGLLAGNVVSAGAFMGVGILNIMRNQGLGDILTGAAMFGSGAAFGYLAFLNSASLVASAWKGAEHAAAKFLTNLYKASISPAYLAAGILAMLGAGAYYTYRIITDPRADENFARSFGPNSGFGMGDGYRADAHEQLKHWYNTSGAKQFYTQLYKDLHDDGDPYQSPTAPGG